MYFKVVFAFIQGQIKGPSHFTVQWNKFISIDPKAGFRLFGSG